MKITSYIFNKSLSNPVKLIITQEENNQLVTKSGEFTIRTYRQKNEMKLLGKKELSKKGFKESIKMHEGK